jgi:7,8-dihydropterin-6-yl-methyl-4-(beta-D-ribofuranosyl)aminobenzene 5'-phosphate synthase
MSFIEKYHIEVAQMRVTALIEDTKPENTDFFIEKGLSLHIQRDDDSILFDTGATGKFVDNANKLGINLQDVDVTAISHGHIDHGGGLRRFMHVNHTSPVYLRTHADGDHFKAFSIVKRDISLDKALFADYADRIRLINEFTELAKDAYLLTDFKTKYPTPVGQKYLYTKKGNQLVHDDFPDELMMVIREDDGLTIFSSCSHHGVLNMVDAAVEKFRNTPIKALFGGFHFVSRLFLNTMAETKTSVEYIGRKLTEYPIEKVFTGHCTGRKAYPILKNVMGNKVDYFATGNSVEL